MPKAHPSPLSASASATPAPANILVSPGQYVARLNALLVTQAWFRPGMAVVLTPPYGYPSRLALMGGMEPTRLLELRSVVDQAIEVRPPLASS